MSDYEDRRAAKLAALEALRLDAITPKLNDPPRAKVVSAEVLGARPYLWPRPYFGIAEATEGDVQTAQDRRMDALEARLLRLERWAGLPTPEGQ